MADATQGTPAPAPNPAPVAAGGGANPVATAPAPVTAQQSVPHFGGLRGGRARADGLVPGSKPALAADREKERARKAAARARQRADPPALPGFTETLADAPGSPAGHPVTGGPAVGVPAGAIPWQDADLKPIFEQLLPAFEQLQIRQLTARAEKGKLPALVIREITKDAQWPDPARKALEMGCPQLAAKYLNKSGIGSEHKEEVLVGVALAAILAGHSALLKKLDKLIADSQPVAPPPPEPAP